MQTRCECFWLIQLYMKLITECSVFTQMYIKLLRQEEMEKLEQLAQDGYDSMLIDFNVGQRSLLRLLQLT